MNQVSQPFTLHNANQGSNNLERELELCNIGLKKNEEDQNFYLKPLFIWFKVPEPSDVALPTNESLKNWFVDWGKVDPLEHCNFRHLE